MSNNGDTVRADIVNAARTEIAKVDRGLASEPWAVRPLLQALDAALARLEAAEAELDEYSTDVGYAAGYEDGKKYAVAQRDALAEALRTVRAEVDLPEHVAEIVGAALAEAGLLE